MSGRASILRRDSLKLRIIITNARERHRRKCTVSIGCHIGSSVATKRNKLYSPNLPRRVREYAHVGASRSLRHSRHGGVCRGRNYEKGSVQAADNPRGTYPQNLYMSLFSRNSHMLGFSPFGKECPHNTSQTAALHMKIPAVRCIMVIHLFCLHCPFTSVSGICR